MLGALVSGFFAEQAMAPAGAQVVFANSSEAIIPQRAAQQIMQRPRDNRPISVVVNNYNGDVDVTQKVINALEYVLNG
jgi:hypothetical protein